MSDVFVFQVAGSAASGALVAYGWQPMVDWLRRTDWGGASALRKEMTEAGMNTAILPIYLIAWRGAAIAALVCFCTVLPMVPVAIALSAVIYHAFPWWIRGRIEVFRRVINGQVVGVARNLAGQVRVGLPLHEAFVEVSRVTTGPLSSHLRATSSSIKSGLEMSTALAALKSRVRVESVITMAVALHVANEFGGKLADVLDRIALSAEEVARLDRKRLTDTASGRLMIRVMAMFPIGFLVFVSILHPGVVAPMLKSTLGHLALATAVLMVYGAVRWASWILARVK